jgi:hypothetical protein
MFDTTFTASQFEDAGYTVQPPNRSDRNLNSIQGIALGAIGGGLIWLALGAALFF